MLDATARRALAPLALLFALAAAILAAPPGPHDFGPEPTSDLFDAYDEKMNGLLDDGDAAAATGDFAKAVAAYQEAADRAAGQVRRVASRTYLGIREYVNGRIHSLPAEGLATYRRLMDPRAEALLADAFSRGDEARLREAARRFALSTHGARARLALGTRALARGENDDALRHFREILRLYPEGEIPGVRRADVISRTAFSAARLGDRQLLAECLKRAAMEPGASVTIGTKDVPLVEFIGSLTAAAAGSAAPEGYATVGGSPARTGARGGPTGPLALRWIFDLPARPADEPARDGPSPALPFHPLIAGDLALLATHSTLYALRLPAPDAPAWKPGEPLPFPEMAFAFPSDTEDNPEIAAGEQPPVFASVDRDAVYLPFGSSDASPIYMTGQELSGSKSRLIAVSLAREGALLDERGGIDPLLDERLRGLQYCGAPAVVGRRVFVAATRSDGMVETFVCCFRDSGPFDRLKPAWSTFVCRGRGIKVGDFDFAPVEASSVAVRHGVVYVCSNAGAVAALDAESGEILWACAYEPARENFDVFTRETVSRRTFFMNPPMMDDQCVFVTPFDADRLFAFHLLPDLRKGFVERGRFPAEDVALGFSPEYLLGVRDGTAFLAGSCRALGETPLFAVRAFSAPDDQSPRVRWRAPIEESAPHGRGLLAGDAIYFPTEKAIYRVSALDGTATRLVDLTADEVREATARRSLAGNLAVSGPWLLSAGEDFLALFGPVPPVPKDTGESGD